MIGALNDKNLLMPTKDDCSNASQSEGSTHQMIIAIIRDIADLHIHLSVDKY